MLQMKFGFNRPMASEDMLFKSVDDINVNANNDGRRTNVHPISSPRAFGSGELIKVENR